MKKIFQTVIISLILISVVKKCSSQEVLGFSNTKIILRYYKSSSKNIERLNDSLTIRIKKTGLKYRITIVNDDKILSTCDYIFRGNYVNREFITRNLKDEGPDLIREKRKVKILEPIKTDCIKNY